MKNVLLYRSILIVFACVQASGEDMVSAWLPEHVGDKWIFQNESRDGKVGGITHPAVARWRTEETIVSSSKIPEGTVVVKRVAALDPVPESVSDREPFPHDRHYLLRPNCVYLLDYFDADPGIDAKHQLRPEFREDLLHGKIDPDLCFPLTGISHWGKNPESSWKVVGVQDSSQGTPQRRTIFHILSTLGNGLTSEVWFEQYVGVVRQITLNRYPYWENTSKLIRFDPAR